MSDKAYSYILYSLYGSLFFIGCTFIPQSDFGSILIWYTILFGLYVFIEKKCLSLTFKSQFKWNLLIKAILILAFPLLSDDIYRFYWDGHLWLNGYSAYAFKPSAVANEFLLDHQLIFEKLNSKEYFSVYPPVLQFFFAICSFCAGKSIFLFSIFWKLILLIADFLCLKILYPLLANKKYWYWWAFNPLLILETYGNGHSEVLIVCMMAYAFFLLIQSQFGKSASTLALAASIKLMPVVLGIYFAKSITHFRAIKFLILLGIGFGISLLPIGLNYSNFLESVRLFFSKFEFNGSVSEIWKWIDYGRKGYDNIEVISKYLSAIILIMAIILFFIQKRGNNKAVLQSAFWFWFFYLIFSTTVHPWYLLPVLFLSMFSEHRQIMIAWSYLVILSYAWYDPYWSKWKYIFITVEYLLLAIFIWWVYSIKNRAKYSVVKK